MEAALGVPLRVPLGAPKASSDGGRVSRSHRSSRRSCHSLRREIPSKQRGDLPKEVDRGLGLDNSLGEPADDRRLRWSLLDEIADCKVLTRRGIPFECCFQPVAQGQVATAHKPVTAGGPALGEVPRGVQRSLGTRRRVWVASHVVGILRKGCLISRDLLQDLADLPREPECDGAGLAERSRVPVHLREHEDFA